MRRLLLIFGLCMLMNVLPCRANDCFAEENQQLPLSIIIFLSSLSLCSVIFICGKYTMATNKSTRSDTNMPRNKDTPSKQSLLVIDMSTEIDGQSSRNKTRTFEDKSTRTDELMIEGKMSTEKAMPKVAQVKKPLSSAKNRKPVRPAQRMKSFPKQVIKLKPIDKTQLATPHSDSPYEILPLASVSPELMNKQKINLRNQAKNQRQAEKPKLTMKASKPSKQKPTDQFKVSTSSYGSPYESHPLESVSPELANQQKENAQVPSDKQTLEKAKDATPQKTDLESKPEPADTIQQELNKVEHEDAPKASESNQEVGKALEESNAPELSESWANRSKNHSQVKLQTTKEGGNVFHLKALKKPRDSSRRNEEDELGDL